MKKIFLLIFHILFINQCFAQSLTVTGGWTLTLTNTNVPEAGLDYVNSGALSSAVNQSTINVTAPKNSVAFIYIQKSDTVWDTRLILEALRTGPGTGAANFSIIGGTTPITITNTPQYFFELRPGPNTKVDNIPIQFIIRGFTVLMPAKTYTTTLLYTITN